MHAPPRGRIATGTLRSVGAVTAVLGALRARTAGSAALLGRAGCVDAAPTAGNHRRSDNPAGVARAQRAACAKPTAPNMGAGKHQPGPTRKSGPPAGRRRLRRVRQHRRTRSSTISPGDATVLSWAKGRSHRRIRCWPRSYSDSSGADSSLSGSASGSVSRSRRLVYSAASGCQIVGKTRRFGQILGPNTNMP
jgi:hypothetical protein